MYLRLACSILTHLNAVRVAVAFALLASVSAQANDTTAELASGGLIFTHNDDVDMRAEDLFVSTEQIRVTYRFFNKADRDITTLVAFPLPEINPLGPGDNIALPTEAAENFLAFATKVDGKPVETKLEQRAIVMGLDRTGMFRALGIPLAPQLASTTAALDKLPPERWDELARLGVAEVEEYDVGQGMQKHLAPRWALQTTYYWEQIFPGGRELSIEHAYQPSVGRSVQTSLGEPRLDADSSYAGYPDKYCLQQDFLAAVTKARRAAKTTYGAPFQEARIAYILKTGANWSGPIKDFRLVVDKAHRLIS